MNYLQSTLVLSPIPRSPKNMGRGGLIFLLMTKSRDKKSILLLRRFMTLESNLKVAITKMKRMTIVALAK
jgi:hypothetical protein